MTLQEIKQAIEQGKTVNWSSNYYEVIKVIKDKNNEYLIRCKGNGHCIGLTWRDGVTMNGNEIEFY